MALKMRWMCKVRDKHYYCMLSNGYYLRCEKMEEGVWFWAIYSPDGELLKNSRDRQLWGKDLKQAKEVAEKSYNSINKKRVETLS